MFKLFVLSCLCCLMISGFASAKATTVSVKDVVMIKELTADFYSKKAIQQFRTTMLSGKDTWSTDPRCDEDIPSRGSCINAICKRLPSYKCDDDSELREYARVCGNNVDGSCIDSICGRLPSYKCDDESEIKEIARICSGPVDGQCIEAACKRMPTYKCDDESEMKDLAQVCSGLIDGGCVDAVCSRLPSYKCDDESEIREVIRSCKGS